MIFEEDGKKISRQAIANVIHRFRTTGSFIAKTKPGRKPYLGTIHLDFIDEQYQANDELSSEG